MGAEQQEEGKGVEFLLPLDYETCSHLVTLLQDPSVQVAKICECAFQDPVLVAAIMKAAAKYQPMTQAKEIVTLKSAIISLGITTLKELAQQLLEQPKSIPDSYQVWVAALKQKCKLTAGVSYLIAEQKENSFAQEVYTIGVLSYLPELYALMKLKDRYADLLQQDFKKSKLRYKLIQNYNFDVEQEGLAYLREYGLPETLLEALDSESSHLSAEGTVRKTLCFSAIEYVDAFTEERFERLAPDKSIPPKSYRRLLRFSEDQFMKLYKEIEQFFINGELTQQHQLQEEAIVLEDTQAELETLDIDLEDETPIIMSVSEPQEFTPEVAPPEKRVEQESNTEMAHKRIIEQFETTDNKDQLLREIMKMLVQDGPFEHIALLVVSEEGQKAVPVFHSSRTEAQPVEIHVEGEQSPLLHSGGKVVSGSNQKSSNLSPFGSGTYAIAPIDAQSPHPVALYADCGNKKVLGFEARRLFRKTVDLLNHMLPDMQGDIVH